MRTSSLLACVLVFSSLASAAQPTTGPFVRVSPRDTRYFELSDGKPYIAIGFNLVPPPAPQDIPRVVETMAKNKVNYCRIWLDHSPWNIEHERSGEYDVKKAENLDRFLALCRQNGIRVKMCIEFFRNITPKSTIWSDKPIHHINNGGPFKDMPDFLNSEAGRAQFKRKLAFYASRYRDEPAIFAWELWNEMNAVRGPWEPWTREMLTELHRLFPNHLCIQSLGSFDTARVREPYRTLCTIENNDIAQVHRYLDLGGQLEICHAPIDELAADAVGELLAFEVRKPIILTETGAVKPRHTGVSDLYAKDRDGMLLHDMIFAPFFCGAAGTGHTWWWVQAIDKPNLWHHFARFATAVEGIDPPAEGFTPMRIEHPRLHIYALKGKKTFAAWCRDSQNNWQSELEKSIPPELIQNAQVDLANVGIDLAAANVRIYDPWSDKWTDAKPNGARIALPPFRRSIVIRIDHN